MNYTRKFDPSTEMLLTHFPLHRFRIRIVSAWTILYLMDQPAAFEKQRWMSWIVWDKRGQTAVP